MQGWDCNSFGLNANAERGPDNLQDLQHCAIGRNTFSAFALDRQNRNHAYISSLGRVDILQENLFWYFPTAPGALIVWGSAGGRANELLLLVSIKRRLHLKIHCSPLSPGPAGWSKWPFYGENTRTGLQPVNQVERELLRCQLWGLFLPLPDLLPQHLPFNFTQTTSDFWNCSALIFATQFRPEQRSVSTWARLQEMWRFSFWSNGQLKRVDMADAYELKKVVQEWKKKTLK